MPTIKEMTSNLTVIAPGDTRGYVFGMFIDYDGNNNEPGDGSWTFQFDGMLDATPPILELDWDLPPTTGVMIGTLKYGGGP